MKRIFTLLAIVLLAVPVFSQRTNRATIKIDMPWTHLTGDTTILYQVDDMDASWRVAFKYKNNTDSIKICPYSAILPMDSLDYAIYAGMDTVTLVDPYGKVHFEDVIVTGTHLLFGVTITGECDLAVKSVFKWKIPKEIKISK